MHRSRGCGLLAALLVLGLASSAHAAAADNWTQWIQTGGDTDTWIRSLSFPIGATLYAAGESDGVFQSPDAGLHYARQSGGLPNNGSGTHEVRSTLGAPPLWVADDDGLYTSMDGTSWTPVGQGPGDNKLDYGVNDVYAFSAQSIVAGTASGGIYTSADGGGTWTKSTGTGANTTVFALTFSGAALYAATSDGMYVSVDGGSSWVLHSDGLPSGAIYRVAAVPGSPQHLYATVYGEGVYESTNGGVTWNDDNGSGPPAGNGVVGELAGASTQVQDFLLAPAGSGRSLIATNGGVFATIDDGASWSEVNPASNTGPDIDENDVWRSRSTPPAASSSPALRATARTGCRSPSSRTRRRRPSRARARASR